MPLNQSICVMFFCTYSFVCVCLVHTYVHQGDNLTVHVLCGAPTVPYQLTSNRTVPGTVRKMVYMCYVNEYCTAGTHLVHGAPVRQEVDFKSTMHADPAAIQKGSLTEGITFIRIARMTDSTRSTIRWGKGDAKNFWRIQKMTTVRE
jgi:hypothetical protein